MQPTTRAILEALAGAGTTDVLTLPWSPDLYPLASIRAASRVRSVGSTIRIEPGLSGAPLLTLTTNAPAPAERRRQILCCLDALLEATVHQNAEGTG